MSAERWQRRGPYLLITDGAYEPDGAGKASIGAVLVDENGAPFECFGVGLSEELLSEFLAESSHPIYVLELFLFSLLCAFGKASFLEDQ